MARKAKKQEVSYEHLVEAMIANGHDEETAKGLIGQAADVEPGSEDEMIGYRFARDEVAAGYEQVVIWIKRGVL